MKIKILSNSKGSLSFILILAMLFILTAGMVPTIGVAALSTHKNGTMTIVETHETVHASNVESPYDLRR